MPIVSCGKYKYIKRGLPREMPEHRYIKHLVDPQENENELVVHHIDGDKSNNDPDNLQWMTNSDHSRLHHLGDNHFPCSGEDNANYRHGMCVGGASREYKRIHNRKTYFAHRESRLAKQNAYAVTHREQKRLYDKIRYWEQQLMSAQTDDRKEECENRLNELKGA